MKFFTLDYYSFMIQQTHYFLDFYNISCIFSCNIPEDPIFTTVYFFDMRAVRIRNRKASTTISSLLMDNSIRQTPKEPCLPLAPLFNSLKGHHSYTDTYYWSQRCVSQRFQLLLKENRKSFLAPKVLTQAPQVWASRGVWGYASPGNLANLISLKQHFLHFDTTAVFKGETG